MYIFKPYYKSVIWGGEKICRLKGEPAPSSCIGESWEVSPMKGCESVVADGPDKGLTLTELTARYGKELLGEDIYGKYCGEFPLLLKIIDAKSDLSVQVHPDQEMARRLHSCSGKTEMWYVVDHEKESKIYNGLSKKITPEDYYRLVEEKRVMEVVQAHHVSNGDVYLVPPGRIHSICAGNLLVEVQQASDITYRVYDYDRRDVNGQPRELHTELAAKAIDFNIYPDHRITYDTDADIVELLSCDYFSVYRLQPRGRALTFRIPSATFAIAICTEGTCVLTAESDIRALSKLHSALIPATAKSLTVGGDGVILIATPK